MKKLGIKWLNSIDEIIEKYKKKFNLYNIRLVKNLTMNILLFASSNEYGEVVMIIEKIYPGYQLNNLKNQEERIIVFCKILNNITIEDIPKSTFQSYEESLKEKIEFVYNDKQKYSNILHMVDIVKNFYSEIKNMNLPKYILHNDLQHKNILKSNDEWKVIDPHGIIGEKIFETTQFIRAELEYTNLDKMDNIITLISKHLNEDKILIYKALYISTFLKLVYYINAKYDINVICYNIEMCDKIYEYI